MNICLFNILDTKVEFLSMIRLPPSYRNRGIKVTADTTVGIPITTPEKVESPPRCCAYSLDEETMMKNETYVWNCISFRKSRCHQRFLALTCSRRLEMTIMMSDDILGSLSSSWSTRVSLLDSRLGPFANSVVGVSVGGTASAVAAEFKLDCIE